MDRQVSGAGARGGHGRGFTLVELLIVMLIIGLVISIVLPALGGARSAARNASTRALCNQLSTAIDLFKSDHSDRMPGYFDAATMGRQENATRGFTALENAMLELAGGVVDQPNPNVITVGPTSSTTAMVDLDRLGADIAGNRVYFAPAGKNLVAQDGTENGLQAAGPDEQRFPDVVDAWGNPVLLWAENEAAIGPIDSADDLARPDSGGTGNLASRFYWSANAGFLSSPRLGKTGRNQAFNATGAGYSLVGKDAPNLQPALVGLLGDPNFRRGTTMTYTDILPSATRGRFLVHSAGPDGIFLGSRDKLGRQFLDASGAMYYGFNWVNQAGQPHTDRNGNPTSIDMIQEFDDVVTTGSN